MAKRLSKKDFDDTAQIINSPDINCTVAELEMRRDYLLDLTDGIKGDPSHARFTLWASDLDIKIQKRKTAGLP